MYTAVCAEVFSQGHRGLEECRYEEVKECVSKAFLNVWSLCPAGFFLVLFLIYAPL